MPSHQRPPNRRELDVRLDDLEPEVAALKARVLSLESANADLEDRLRKLEGQKAKVVLK